MKTTVKKLIEMLSEYPNQDAFITDQENREFIHMSNLSNGDVILSVEKPIGYCKRTGGYAFPTYVEDYLAVVPELDENVDLCEIELPNLNEEENPIKFGKPITRESKYKKAFETVMEYFDSIDEEEKPKLLEKLTNLGV